jgi:hypothetical protein
MEFLEREGDRLPRNVVDAVTARLRPLSPETRRVVDLIAMVPGRYERVLVNRVDIDRALTEAREHRLLEFDQKPIWFRHELTRPAVESATPARRRFEPHRLIAQELGNGGFDPARIVCLPMEYGRRMTTQHQTTPKRLPPDRAGAMLSVGPFDGRQQRGGGTEVPSSARGTGRKEGVMTLTREAPVETATAVREPLSPAHVSSSMRNLALLLIAVLAITAAVVVALVLIDSEPAEIHDSWMNLPGAVQTVEIHDSWANG